MIKKYFLIIALGLATFFVKGQGETIIIVNYLPSVSFGEIADFTDMFSSRGIDFEVNYFVAEDLSVGFVGSWNIFQAKVVGESFEYKEWLVTGTQFRYTNTVPLNVNVKKYFGDNDVVPYVGVGLGTMYAKKSGDVGVFTFSDDKWLLNVAPEIGMLYDISRNNVLSLKLKYNYGLKAGDFPSISYVSFGVGIGMR